MEFSFIVITILKNKPEGSFLVRDSNTFFGSYGLAVKVDRLPPNVKSKSGILSLSIICSIGVYTDK